MPVDVTKEATVAALNVDVTKNTLDNNSGESCQGTSRDPYSRQGSLQEVVPIQTAASTGASSTNKAANKPTFRIDPSLISGVKATPNVTCNVTNQLSTDDKSKSTEPPDNANTKSEIVSFTSNTGDSKATEVNDKPGESLPVMNGMVPQHVVSSDDSNHMIIRRDSANSITQIERKPMLSFETPMPSVESIKNNLDKLKTSLDVNRTVEINSKKIAEENNKSIPVENPFINKSASESRQKSESPLPAVAVVDQRESESQQKNQRINLIQLQPKEKASEPASVKPPTRAQEQKPKSSEQVDEEQVNVSNVIKRFNDKCESIANSKQESSKLANTAHSTQSSRASAARPMYATMDCRSKRNNLMTRGYTVSEYSVRAETFRRQASVSSNSQPDPKSRPKAHGEHTTQCVHCTKSGGHCKTRSKSQSSADDDLFRRSGYDNVNSEYRSNVTYYRVRFDESSLRTSDQQPSQSFTQRRTRPASAHSDQDEDFFEKYETLV